MTVHHQSLDQLTQPIILLGPRSLCADNATHLIQVSQNAAIKPKRQMMMRHIMLLKLDLSYRREALFPKVPLALLDNHIQHSMQKLVTDPGH